MLFAQGHNQLMEEPEVEQKLFGLWTSNNSECLSYYRSPHWGLFTICFTETKSYIY